MQLIEEYAKQFKSQSVAATFLGTSRQQLWQWINSTRPVYVHKGEIYRKLT